MYAWWRSVNSNGWKQGIGSLRKRLAKTRQWWENVARKRHFNIVIALLWQSAACCLPQLEAAHWTAWQRVSSASLFRCLANSIGTTNSWSEFSLRWGVKTAGAGSQGGTDSCSQSQWNPLGVNIGAAVPSGAYGRAGGAASAPRDVSARSRRAPGPMAGLKMATGAWRSAVFLDPSYSPPSVQPCAAANGC